MTTETESELINVVVFPQGDDGDPAKKINFLLETDGDFVCTQDSPSMSTTGKLSAKSVAQ